jgi:hypothetical protein
MTWTGSRIEDVAHHRLSSARPIVFANCEPYIRERSRLDSVSGSTCAVDCPVADHNSYRWAGMSLSVAAKLAWLLPEPPATADPFDSVTPQGAEAWVIST